MKYLGIDLHSNRFTCCMIDEEGSKNKFTFNIDPESLDKFISILSHDTYVMIEASTNTFKFVELIKEKFPVWKKEIFEDNTYLWK